jgi:hypothetical protein
MEAPPGPPPPEPNLPEDAASETPLGFGYRYDDPNSPLAPVYARPVVVGMVAFLALALLFYSWRPLWHTDIWGHLAIGRWIVQHGRLPDHEPLTAHGDQSAAMGHFEWLAQTGAYLFFSFGQWRAGGDEIRQLLGGAEVLRAVSAMLVTLTLLLLILAYSRKSGTLGLALLGATVYLILAVHVGTVQRPQIVGQLFFACLLLALSREVLSRRSVILLPLLFVLWANIHGSFSIGLILLGVAAAGRVIEVWRMPEGKFLQRARGDAQLRRLILVGLLAGAGVLCLNPHGPRLLPHMVALARHPNILILDEWQPLHFHWGPGGQWSYLATLAVLLLSQVFSRRFYSPTAILLILVFGAGPVFRERMMLWWLMLLPWLVMPLWSDLASRWTLPRWQPNLLNTLSVVIIIGLTVLWCPLPRWLVSGEPRQEADRLLSGGTPWRVAAELAASGEHRGKSLPPLRQALDRYYEKGEFAGRIFPSETQGDYLAWALPEFEVLWYTHAHLFSKEHWAQCLRAKSAQPGWREHLDRFSVNLVVIEPRLHERFADRLRRDPDWQVVLDEADDPTKPDGRASLFVALRKRPILAPGPSAAESTGAALPGLIGLVRFQRFARSR